MNGAYFNTGSSINNNSHENTNHPNNCISSYDVFLFSLALDR